MSPSKWQDPHPHHSRFAAVNGVKLNYLDWGDPRTGRTLIFIHGYGDNPHAFDDMAPAFTDTFRVLAYARRGHGRSEGKPPYDTATLTQDLRALMDALHVERASLVGWSMGGNEITSMAATHPERVDRIVYLDAAYDWSDPLFKPALQAYPVDPNTPTSALKSLDAYRAWSLSLSSRLKDVEQIEPYIQEQVTINPDGSVKLRMSPDVEGPLWESLLADHKDYAHVKVKTLAIYSETFLDLDAGDKERQAKVRAWEQQHAIPFRNAAKARLRRELSEVEIVTVPGSHGDFVYTARDQVIASMHRFLGP